MQHVEAPVSGDSALSGGQHPAAVTLPVFLLPHDCVLPNVPHHACDEGVIAFVYMHGVRQAVLDAGHARCNTEKD
jgi:hypothetical protein